MTDHAKPLGGNRYWVIAAAAIGACVFELATPLSAQVRAGDPPRGLDLALRLCSGCHAVVPNSSPVVNPDIPSFAAIVRERDATAERLAGRIIIPHPPMPNTQLTVAELQDVIAYMLTLKPSR
jgi:mono/diheme cytochrome c family protein